MMFAGQAVAEDWKDALGLSSRHAPEVYSDASDVGDVPYAKPIRTALSEMGADSVFCVQDVPTAVFFAAEADDEGSQTDIAQLHSNLWNQGLASVLAIVRGNTIRIYSLAARPLDRRSDRLDKDCLIEVLDKVADAVQVRSLIRAMESGRYWQEHRGRFDPKQRVDGTLLRNLKQSDRRLRLLKLPPEAAQALLMQTMFIAYLEDRKIIGSGYINEATGDAFSTFSDILEAGKVTAFYALFRRLNKDFNGDLFIKPCSFGNTGPKLRRDHMPVLASFRGGMVEMGKYADQGLLFWAYDFKFIPVELISAVYDQFLGAQDRAPKGQFHTPMQLATSVVSQFWDDPQLLTSSAKEKGRILDPACGSGIFLACIFKRLCEHRRQSKCTEKIQWPSLLALLGQLTGLDIDASAVRIAIFSLYVALLEEVTPPDIRGLMAAGKMLPMLWGKGLRHTDFFNFDAALRYDLVIGNPPWRSGDQNAARWCRQRDLPVPDKQAAWGFVWKALRHLKEDGKLAMLLPAKPFLHNHSKTAVEARKRLFREVIVRRILNYADLRRQLFGTAIQPAALFVLKQGRPAARYQFDYWAPKAGPGLRTARLLSISNADKKQLDSMTVENDPLEFTKRLWMNGPEDKLFRYLGSFPRLRTKVTQFKSARYSSTEDAWIIGQGFKPAVEDRLTDPSYDYQNSDVVAEGLFLHAEKFRAFSPDLKALTDRDDGWVHAPGFTKGFSGPRVLVLQGAGSGRLKACYTDEPFTFQHAIQAIVVPDADRTDAKLLSALLNSKLMFWYAFHGTSSISSERPKVHQDQLLDLPFPMPSDTPEVHKSLDAKEKLITLWDESKRMLDDPLQSPNLLSETLKKVDALAYDYFCLADEEIVLVEDTLKFIVPAIQPGPSVFPEIWKPTTENDRRNYALYLNARLSVWLKDDTKVNAALEALNQDVAILRLDLCAAEDAADYHEGKMQDDVGRVLAEVAGAVQEELPGEFLSMPDLRVVVGMRMYLVKPNQKRFWLGSAGLADADDIVVDLQQQLMQGGRGPGGGLGGG